MQKILVRNAQTITVAGGKDYNDLDNKPSINSVELEGNKTLHELGIQQEGNYLTEIPSDYKTKSQNDELYQAKGNYATINDLNSKQDVIDTLNKLSADLVDDTNTTNKFVSASDKANWNAKSNFSGDYNDLTNKPTIPNPQVQSDWNATTGMGVILNKPTIPTVPTNVSSFTNDANYQNATQVQSAIDSVVGNINTILATLTTPGGNE